MLNLVWIVVLGLVAGVGQAYPDAPAVAELAFRKLDASISPLPHPGPKAPHRRCLSDDRTDADEIDPTGRPALEGVGGDESRLAAVLPLGSARLATGRSRTAWFGLSSYPLRC